MSSTVFVKAQYPYFKGFVFRSGQKIMLDFNDVKNILSLGVKEGDKITVKVKVGKKRKLVKAYLMGEREHCGGCPPSGILYYVGEV